MKIKGKIYKTGNSYAITIPRALVESEILKNGRYYIIKEIEELIEDKKSPKDPNNALIGFLPQIRKYYKNYEIATVEA